jgi:hypothetical protein
MLSMKSPDNFDFDIEPAPQLAPRIIGEDMVDEEVLAEADRGRQRFLPPEEGVVYEGSVKTTDRGLTVQYTREDVVRRQRVLKANPFFEAGHIVDPIIGGTPDHPNAKLPRRLE